MSLMSVILHSQSHIFSCFITSCFTLHTLISPDNTSRLISKRLRTAVKDLEHFGEYMYRIQLLDSKMYHFVCFILVVSLEGIKTQSPNSTTNDVSNTTSSQHPTADITPNNFGYSTNTSTMMYTNNKEMPTSKSTNTNSNCQTTADKPNSNKQADCLIGLTNIKEMLPFFITAFLSVVCILLLLIIMCLACKSCRGVRNDKMVVMKSSRRSSVNGGPSELEVRYSSVKVEIETTPDEEQERTPEEEVGGAAAEVGVQVSAKENTNSANDTTETIETAPTQKVDQSGQTDLEDLEKAE
ncbi:hypothetical protein QTP70_015570 [Hemibagrus guttatus]|uniref:Uncharacterized protein n=1 Tax=Hemibagrus guttatus TaxID=175788 RepID=A0AAE0QIZ5_9TELE|nr:hypothetical protein QTP70_015570 [Hemibagrus guttatus]